jgi:hypothetical protein
MAAKCKRKVNKAGEKDYLLPLKEQEEDQSLFAKVGQG